jgi:hypothetical protein
MCYKIVFARDNDYITTTPNRAKHGDFVRLIKQGRVALNEVMRETHSFKKRSFQLF